MQKQIDNDLLRYFDGDEMSSNVWLNKYALRDEDGKLTEKTPDDMHRRMAKYFADVEEKYEFKEKDGVKLKLSEYGYNREKLNEEKIYSLFKDFKYIVPGGSVMSGLGSKLPVSLSNCFVGGTKVLTKLGIKNIEDIKEGDFVLSDDGEFHEVVATMERDYSGDLYKFTSLEFYEPIICTPNHKLLTNNGWKRADRILAPHSKQIHSCDKLRVANDNNKIFSHNGEGQIINLSDNFVSGDNVKLIEEDNKLFTETHFIGGNGSISKKLSNKVNSTFVFDSDFAYFVGRWIGDGSITRRVGKRNHSILQIVFNATTERDSFERCKKIGEEKFGLEASVRETEQNVLALRFENELVASWFYREFGEKSDGKFIPSKYDGNLNILLGICDSDGFIYNHGSFKIFLKNDNVIKWLRNTFYLNCINASEIHLRNNGGYHSIGFEITANQSKGKLNHLLTKSYSDNRRNKIALDIDDYARIENIEIIENQNVKVYNLSVKDTHTYNVNGIICHNCWVIDGPNDSIDDIFRVCNEQSQLFKRRGGNGFDISKLRPNGAKVNNSAKYSTGAVSFMDLFSNVTNTIAQSGRRGALMISMHIEHPDSEEFIEKKQDLSKVTGANISLQIGDDFMEAVCNDSDFLQKWPINSTPNIDSNASLEYGKLYEGVDVNGMKCYYKKIKAKDLWNKLVHCAWNTAEPGIIFKTNHYEYSPDGLYEQFRGTSTNPCGEIFMHEDSCRLIHVNLSSFIENEYTKDATINDEKLYEVFYEATRLGDDLVDLEKSAIEKILSKIENDGDKDNNEYKLYARLLTNTLNGRRCGVGFFGLADAIAKLGFKFDSSESLEAINHIMRVMFVAEMDSEIDMAITRGTFPSYDSKKEEKSNRWYKMVKEQFPTLYEKMFKYGRRNVSFSTAAPTGSVAMLSHCSSGIEPIFMPFYTRRVKCINSSDRVDYVDKDGEKFTEYVMVHYPLRKWAHNLYGDDIDRFTSKEWQEVYEKSPWFGSTANSIDWKKRVKIQSICQKYITHSISSTVNLPNDVKENEVATIYLEAWKQGLKGITVYRDGCRGGVFVSTDKKEKPQPQKDAFAALIENGTAKRRPKTLEAKIVRFSNKGEKWVGIVGMLDDKPYELFTGMLDKLNIPNWVESGFIIKNYDDIEIDGETKKKSRYDLCYIDKDGYRVCVEGISRIFNPEFWNYGKLISGLLRHNMPIQYIIKVISTLKLDDSSMNTWKNGVVRALRKFEGSVEIEDEKCPECGGRLIREGGCIHCMDCGYSKCS